MLRRNDLLLLTMLQHLPKPRQLLLPLIALSLSTTPLQLPFIVEASPFRSVLDQPPPQL